MKIKTQFIIIIVVFSVILLIIAASVATTEQQVAHLNAQEEIANSIERGASSLNSVSIDYFLYQEDLQLSRWHSVLSSLSMDLSNLKLDSPQHQTFAINVAGDLQRLTANFDEVITYLQTATRNVSIRIDPAFQVRWSSMAVQSEALAFDSSQLSHSLDNQIHQTNYTNTLLIVSLVGAFGAFLATIYLMVFRRTLKSVAGLQNGINTIGSGNLDYKIKTEGRNEITELSNAFNQMTTNLKTVTASKTELEKEIAGRKQAEASLHASEERWATTLASIGDAVIATDLSGSVLFMNGVAEELTGWTLIKASQKPIKNIFQIIDEQTRKEVEDPVSRVLEKGMIIGLANHTVLIRKDGTEVAIDDSGAPIKDKDGKTTGVVLIFRDITERKKAEDALNRANEDLEERVRKRTEEVSNERQRLYKVLETLPAYVVLLDKNYRVPFANKVFRERFGESYGRRCHEYLFNLDSPCENCETYKVLKTNKSQHWEWTGPDSRNYDIYDYPFVEADGSTLILEMGIDVTERKKAEETAQESARKLKDAERLAAIGATAGMVGHDIRNPLQAITSDVYLAKTDLVSIPESEEKNNIQESLEEIEKNISYINKIVADLQDFAKPLTPKLEETDLEKTVHFVLGNINIPGNVTVKHSVRRDFPKLKVDQSYLQRILTNLVNNAIQAMPNGGKLTIAASSKDGKVMITVEDTGEGIPEEVRGKLFTPLVTTKSKGQGFGLSVVKRFTEGLGGTVKFESTIGKGTKFTIELPA